MSDKNSDRPARKYFRCGSKDHLIAKCPKPPKDGEKKNKKVSFKDKERGNSANDNSDDDDDLKVYASMAQMSNDDLSKNKYYGDSSQLTNWILDSGAICHMTPEVTDFIPGSLEDTDKFIELQTDTTSPQNKKYQYAYKCFTITEKLLSRRYITSYWHQTCATDYFPSLR